MTVNKLLTKAKQQLLRHQKEETVALLLLQHVTNMSLSQLYQMINNKTSSDIENDFNELLKKHITRNVPVQYLIGYQNFFGYDFHVNENVLIPRYETEELVEHILYEYDEYFANQKIKVVDIGTGSGCIGITLALEEPNLNVTITDISSKALEIASKNALKHNVSVNIIEGDMLTPLMGMKFDILVSNPPYIPQDEYVMPIVKNNEPDLALFGGDDGLKFYREILKKSEEILNPKAFIAFEHAFDKAEEIRKIAQIYYPDAIIKTFKDLQNRDRITFIIRGFN